MHLALLLLLAAQPLVFIQMSDPQFGMYTSNKDFAQETANFEFAIATANRLRPAFVVVTGDLVNRAGDPAATAEYRRIAAKLDPSIRLYNVPGNHDVSPETLAAWRERFGPDYYSFRAGDMAAFVLNTCLFAPGMEAEAARQEEWLRAELAKARREGAKRLVVFQHHPFFLKDPEEKDAYFNVPLAVRAKYLELLRANGVSHVFAGHYHRNDGGRAGELEMVTTGPIGKPLGKGTQSGMRIGIVRANGIEHRWYDFGNLPNQVELEPAK